MIKLQWERPSMFSAVFCGNVPCPRVCHGTKHPVSEPPVGKSQISHRCSCSSLLSLRTQPQTALKSPFSPWGCILCVHPLRNHGAGFFHPWAPHFCRYIPYPVQHGYICQEKQIKLVGWKKQYKRNWWEFVIDHGRGNTLGEANMAHLSSKAWWHLSVLFSPLCWPASSLVLGKAKCSDHQKVLLLQKPSGQLPLPPPRSTPHHDPELPGDDLWGRTSDIVSQPESLNTLEAHYSFLSSFLYRVSNKQGLEPIQDWDASKNIPPKSWRNLGYFSLDCYDPPKHSNCTSLENKICGPGSLESGTGSTGWTDN